MPSHNFITHLLEAAFQRKVYTLIEEGGTFGASKLNSIMKEVLTEFWEMPLKSMTMQP